MIDKLSTHATPAPPPSREVSSFTHYCEGGVVFIKYGHEASVLTLS